MYNLKMGGVDLADRMISYYRMKARVNKWAIRTIFHLFDLALSNSWAQYSEDMRTQKKPQKEIMKFLEFRLSVAECLVVEGCKHDGTDSDSDGEWAPPAKRPNHSTDATKDDSSGHFPRIIQEKIQEWLTSKKITYAERMIKKQLLELVASVKSRFLSYIVDNAAVSTGCIVLRLPPYHCEFNPIELVWAKVKNGIAADNRDFKLSTVDAILREKIKHAAAEDWAKSIQHVMDLEAKFRLDTSGSEHIQPIIIQLGEDDTEESDSDCELSGIEPLDEA
ncbi:uncharacterized protein LOC144132658 [Amblyomma americanum]